MVKIASLFSGIGGFEKGMMQASDNVEIVFASEIDKFARKIYTKNFGVEPHGDITKIEAANIPDHDILCAGFPCQSFSNAGKRRGFQDIRGTLFFEIMRIAKHKKPKVLFLENVPGLLSHDKGKTFQTILRSLDEVGYDAGWQVFNSKDHGVPQNRERVFIIGYLRGSGTKQIFPITENGTPSSTPGATKNKHASTAISTTVTPMCRQTDTFIDETNLTVHSLHQRSSTNGNGGIGQLSKDTGTSYCLDCKNNQAVETKPPTNKPLCIDSNGRIDEHTTGTIPSRYYKGVENYGSSPFIMHELKQIRKLTETECERLQGFPDGWTEGVSMTQRYKCLGNTVTVNVIEFIGKRLIQMLHETQKSPIV